MTDFDYWTWHGTNGEVRECRSVRVLLMMCYFPRLYAAQTAVADWLWWQLKGRRA